MTQEDLRSTLARSTMAILFAATLFAGCNKGGSGETAGGESDAALVTAGKAVYGAHGCANCHSINGQGGRKAPELTKVAANPEHTSEWLVAHIKNPKSHNPASRMPGFEGKIDDKDLLALGAYLASLK